LAIAPRSVNGVTAITKTPLALVSSIGLTL
jgi:hypothetical protein